MKIATMATGGIGGYLAVRLTQAGLDVAAIARGAHLTAIQANGLRLEAVTRGETGLQHDVVTTRPWRVTDAPEEVGPVDAVIFAVKGDGLEPAAEALRPMLGPETVVLPFLNGVEASARLAAILPERHVGDGVARISTTVAAPGVIRQTGAFATFQFAERDSRPSPRIDALRAAFRAAGVDAPEVPDVEAELWRKFVLFSAVSGVTAAARCAMGDVIDTPALGRLFQTVLAETAAVGRARGVALEPDLEAKIWAGAQTMPRTMRASTAIDLEAGRPLEIEWISGAAARLAEAAGLAAPANQALYAVLSPFRRGAEGAF